MKRHAMNDMSIYMKKTRIVHEENHALMLLEPVDFNVQFMMPVNYHGWVAAYPISSCRWITATVNNAKFNITRDLYCLLMLVSWENFAPPYPEKLVSVNYDPVPLKHSSIGPPIAYYFDAWTADPTLIDRKVGYRKEV